MPVLNCVIIHHSCWVSKGKQGISSDISLLDGLLRREIKNHLISKSPAWDWPPHAESLCRQIVTAIYLWHGPGADFSLRAERNSNAISLIISNLSTDWFSFLPQTPWTWWPTASLSNFYPWSIWSNHCLSGTCTSTWESVSCWWFGYDAVLNSNSPSWKTSFVHFGY